MVSIIAYVYIGFNLNVTTFAVTGTITVIFPGAKILRHESSCELTFPGERKFHMFPFGTFAPRSENTGKRSP